MRRHLDQYETSELAVNELVKYVPGIRGVLFECCAGKGAISLALRKHFPTFPIITNDIDVTLPASHHFDASKRKEWSRYRPEATYKEIPDWTITNPPFTKAFEILVNAYDHSIKGIAFLLRLSFLEPTYERQDWLNEHPPHHLIVLPRYSFTDDGKTDSVTTAWFVWYRDAPWKPSNIVITKKHKL